MYTKSSNVYRKGFLMKKKLPIILLIVVASLSTVACGLFSMIGDLIGGEPEVEETEVVVIEPT
jgi:hypothetical protein